MSETYAKKSSRATQQQTRTARKKKKLTADSRRRARRAGEVAALLPESRDGLLGLMQESMQTFAVEVGALVARELLEDEIVKVCGPRYERVAERLASRHGHQSGFITIAGQKVRIEKPRARSQDGGELELESYAAMQDDQVMPQATLQRMVRGVSCRDYEGVIDAGREAFGVKKSSVSRGFVRASRAALEQFATRRFDDQRFVAIFIDGIDFAGEMMVCALGLSKDGTKHILGLRQGDTENTQVVTGLLVELRDRGINTDHKTLFVVDGAKALVSGIRKVWGDRALIQRCQVHKKRNVQGHLSKEHHPELNRRLTEAYGQRDHGRAVALLKDMVTWLKKLNPDAAASLAEGLEETVTIIRLGITGSLRRTLSTTNPIESAFSRARVVTGRVKRWRDGDMRHRWCLAGLQRAEDSFRRVRGFRAIPALIKVLDADSIDASPSAA